MFHMNKLILGLVALVIIGAGAYFYLSGGASVTFSVDTALPASEIPAKVVLENGATLTVEGNWETSGSVTCKGGSATIIVAGDLDLDGDLKCAGGDIALVVSGALTVGDGATVMAGGHVQVVSDKDDLLTTDAEIEAAYVEAGKATGDGPRFGPFVEDGLVSVVPTAGAAVAAAPAPFFIKVAHADDGEGHEARDKDGNIIPDVVIGGDWIVGEGGEPPEGVAVETPGKKIKKIILNFDFGKDGNVQLQDFHLVGPAGRDGESDEGKGCNARGTDGENAMRFTVRAKNITVNNFRIELGNGGAGGTAETTRDCDPGIAKGGKGGEAGNIKMMAEAGIVINSMTIVPGAGGNGGGATAYGKDGVNACPGTKGGDATATGGDGGKNKKELSANGAVSGIGNVTIQEVIGGFAGSAFAYPGKGGNGTGCNCNGGAGGKATATGGKGGDASVKAGGAVAASGATGGDGGDAEAIGGGGGAGGQCPLKPKGGDGGKGGDATAKEGEGGTGNPTNGEPGEVKQEKGGNGGNGGDGCGPGGGGKGGKGREPGVDGKPGTLVCPVEEKKPDTSVTPPTPGASQTTPTESSGSAGSGPSTSSGQAKPIQVIGYQGKYLPVDQLIVEDEVGCGAAHWHAAQGIVVATDGSQVSDPGPQCGFGKVQDLPVMPYVPR